MLEQKPNRTALITGASAGLGAEFARQLAARGDHLVLTARRRERLERLAGELRDRHGVEVSVYPADLADSGSPARLCQQLQADGIAVDVLVNNAGYGVTGILNRVDWQAHHDFLTVMVNAVVELCYRLLPGMQQRGFGEIINVASMAALVPGAPGHTLYAASKAFLVRFSESLAMENLDNGIKVQALCPGFTYTAMMSAAPANRSRRCRKKCGCKRIMWSVIHWKKSPNRTAWLSPYPAVSTAQSTA